MDTSDSEQFESADEDLDSDSDTVVKNEESETIENVEPKVPIKDKSTGSEIKVEHINHKTDSTNTELEVDVKYEKTTKIPIKQVEKSDENLWDDDELDWGTETQLDMQANLVPDVKSEEKKETLPPTQTKFGSEEKTETPSSDSWGGWGTWGASVLSSATHGVTSITSQLSNVIETSLGVVDPEELAKINMQESKLKETPSATTSSQETEETGPFGFGNLVKLMENTGTKVISGGLDTLETIGKKTMEVLQDGDPGLKKKRAFLKIDQNKPVLSQILREAKEKAENEPSPTAKPHQRRLKNYEVYFDDYQGLVHLEALELLSKQCEIKMQNAGVLTHDNVDLEQVGQIFEEFSILCEAEEDDSMSLDETKENLSRSIDQIGVEVNYSKLLTIFDVIDSVDSTEDELHEKAIETLAQFTSVAMELFHKIGELLLIKSSRNIVEEAFGLVDFTIVVTSLINAIASKFSEKLNSKKKGNKSEKIVNVFFEAANSDSYIKNAVQLFIPILQVEAHRKS